MYSLDQSIPVSRADGTPYEIPWVGGLNTPEYNKLDLNQDGIADLVVFDRMANKVSTLIRDGERYRYAPEYETLFPNVSNWLLIRDYNCDGKPDIFTGDVLGIRVFINRTPPRGPLAWEQFRFFAGEGLPKSDVLLTKGFSGLINLQLQFDDLPAISDIDGDGDLDILTVNYTGEGGIEFHQNFSQERYGTCDSLEFERITQRWGNVLTCSCGEFAFGGDGCPPHGGGRIKHSEGKGLLAYDFDNDGDIDLVLSNGNCEDVYLLENTGDAVNPDFTLATLFPQPNPAHFPLYPAPFMEDINGDNLLDLVVSAQVFAKDHLQINLQESSWLYLNTGTNELPVFAFEQRDFLQDDMIDVGDGAVPAFMDTDGDGDLDLVVGQMNTGGELTGSLTYFENIGTRSAPAFKLVTDDYLNFKSHGFYNIKPQFYDANGDGRTDLVFTATSSTNQATGLYVLHNKANSGLDVSGQTPVQISFDMLFSENVNMTDVDADGLPDVIIGKTNGSLQYWRNGGPAGSVNLALEKSDYLGFGSSVERQSLAIHTADLDDDGRADLIIGDQYGNLGIINDFRQTSQEVELISDIVYNAFTDSYTTRNLGGRLWPAAARLFETSPPVIAFGSILGGVGILRNDGGLPPSPDLRILVYPNPAQISEGITIWTDRQVVVQLVSMLGQELTTPVTLEPFLDHKLPLPRVASGLYLLRVTAGGRNYTRRLVIF
jgi:hypothetical protein